MPRNTDYTPELGDLICERIASGESLRTICSDDDMPNKATVFRWLAADAAFRDQYARAREAQADTMAEELLDIADDGTNDFVTKADGDGNSGAPAFDSEHVQRSRLRVDARKWLMSKMAPKKYGDKLDVQHAGNVDVVFTTVYETK